MVEPMTALLQLAAIAAVIPAVTLCSWRKGRNEGYIWGPAGWLAIGVLVFGGLGRNDWLAAAQAAGAATVWALWRLQPRKLFGESMTPRNGREILAALAHHSVAVLLLVPLWTAWAFIIPAVLVFAAAATVMAVERAQVRYRNGDDIGPQVEAWQGLGFALVLASALLVR